MTESHQQDGTPEPTAEPPQPPAPDAASTEAAGEALRRATGSTRPAKRRRRTSPPQASSDPELLGSAVDRLIRDQGWSDRSSVAVLMAQWAEIVGADLAAHVVPTSFGDGELVLQAESTTWATQVRLLRPQLQRAIDERVGGGVVTSISIVGPAGPTWRSGSRRVKGRGPRDTYG